MLVFISIFGLYTILLVIIGYFVYSEKKARKNLEQYCNSINNDKMIFQEKLAILDKENAVLNNQLSNYENICNKNDNEISNLRALNENLTKENSKTTEKLSIILEKEQTFIKQFDDLARKILQDNTDRLHKHSTSTLEVVLTPFKEKLMEFHNKVDEVYMNEAKERASLKTYIDLLAQNNNKLAMQAENLSKALKGDNKIQGDWGEIQLERILQLSGLEKDIDYTLQGVGYSLKDSDTGKLQKPDVIINLPDNKHIIIDSKVNLVSYEKYINAEQDIDKVAYLKQFLVAIKEQIKNLNSKNYQRNTNLDSPDFVIMFVPIESVYKLATMQDNEIFSFATEKNIIIASPSTLLAALKTVAHILSSDRKIKNFENILKHSSDMYDKFIDFVNVLVKIGDSIDKSKEHYQDAMKKLKSGKGNLISKAERLAKLGLISKKSFSIALKDDDAIFIAEEEHEML